MKTRKRNSLKQNNTSNSPVYDIQENSNKDSSEYSYIASPKGGSGNYEIIDQSTEEKYRYLFETISQGVIYQDIDGRIVSANPSAQEILGLNLEQLQSRTNHNIHAIAIKEDGSEFGAEQHPSVIALKTGRPVLDVIMGFFNEIENDYRWTTVNATPCFKSGESKPYQTYITLTDLTKRKKAEEAYRESRNLLQMVLDETSDPIYIKDSLSRILLCNPALEKLVGKPITEIIGKTDSEYFGDEVVGQKLREHDLKVMGSSQTLTVEETVPTQEGKKTFISNKAPYRNAAGEIIGIIGISHDITERKRIEETLRENEEYLKKIFDTVLAGFVIIDAESRTIVDINNMALNMVGYEINQVIGTSCHKLICPNHLGKCPLIDLHQNIDNSERKLITKSGVIDILKSVVPIIKGGRQQLLEIFIDITQLKQAETALRKAKDELNTRVLDRTQQLQQAYEKIIQSQKELTAANKQLKNYANRITNVQEEERKRIAYELHDDTAQYLSILKMQLGALAESEDIQNPKVKEKLQFLEKDADRAFQDVRRYSHELRPTTLEHQGLVAALEQMAEDFNKLGQLFVEVHIVGMEPELSEEVKLGFFRIAQEALNNCRKHAKANNVNINVKFNYNLIQMMVNDDGVGFNLKDSLKRSGSKGSMGLMSMRERADLINADLRIVSGPGKGTRIVLKAKNITR
jgi:PAS domain S-box-containing protein